MNSQTKSTYERIVDLLNHASLMSKDVDKITNLKIVSLYADWSFNVFVTCMRLLSMVVCLQVEELIINKEPSLLDNFLEVSNLHTKFNFIINWSENGYNLKLICACKVCILFIIKCDFFWYSVKVMTDHYQTLHFMNAKILKPMSNYLVASWILHLCNCNAYGFKYVMMQGCLTTFYSQEMLAFQTDRSVEVKKYIVHFMAVAG